MPDPEDHKDQDTTIIKPMAFTGVVLMSAGAGLAAGLLICWLFCCGPNDDDDQRALSSVSASQQTVDMRLENYPAS